MLKREISLCEFLSSGQTGLCYPVIFQLHCGLHLPQMFSQAVSCLKDPPVPDAFAINAKASNATPNLYSQSSRAAWYCDTCLCMRLAVKRGISLQGCRAVPVNAALKQSYISVSLMPAKYSGVTRCSPKGRL